ncbi:MAG: T9SS type A sorting domain-containing protein [Bacteroidetes bacterium]|jgi:hypothetical protein|nr:T9SS type A sorting domain-containing protein [Bacteroidota bacterium]
MNASIQKIVIGIILTIFVAGWVFFGLNTQVNEVDVMPSVEFKRKDLKERIDLAFQQEFDRTKDPLINRVPRERLLDAYEVIREQEAKQGKAAISGITWSERGPNNVGGRNRVIMFDASDVTNKTVFVGSVAGGLWKTTNIYASQVEWIPVNDFFSNMAVTSLAQDPTNPAIMYFGTGEGYSNSDAVKGDGIWKSTDTGSTWTQLTATTGDNFSYVNKLIVDGSGNLIAGTKGYYINNGGVYRSTDGGTSFTEVLERYTATSTSEWDRCADVELAADGKTFYAAMGLGTTDGIFKSTDSAKTWTMVYDADSESEQRIDLVCAPSNSSYIYALVQGSGSSIKKIMKSTDGGSSWTSCTTISWNDQCSSASTDFTRNQAWYNLASVVDPDDEDILYVGGINLFRTTNAGTSWSQLSSWVGCGGYSEVHSDHHVLIFAPGSSDTLINGNDGGVYITTNSQASPPTWEMINNGFNVTQFYAGAIHPTALSSYFLTGSQDNGSQRFQYGGINSTDEVTGGDGGYCHIDQEDPETQITAYTYNNIRISTNGFNTYTSYSSSVGNFINASDYDSDNKILYSSSNSGTMYRWSNVGGTLSTSNLSVSAMNSSQASAILVSPNDPTTVYVGTEAGRVVRITDANGSHTGINISTGLPSSVTVSCIAEDPFDPGHLLVTYSNYGTTSVWESTDTGGSWASVEGNLPDMPIRWAIFSPWGGDSALLATELGVWSTTNLNSGGTTNWAVSNTGLANCRVDMLQYRASDSLIMAATHGRGVFTTSYFSERIVSQIGCKNIAYVGEEISFYDNSYGATSWSWDFENDGNVESTSQNPTYTFGKGGLYTVKLTINGTTSSTKTVQILPNLGVPYSTSDGGDMESNAWHFGGRILEGGSQLWERGGPSSNTFTSRYHNGSNAWVTVLDGDLYEANVKSELLSPNFNFSSSGTYTLSFIKSMHYRYSNAPFAVQVHYSTDKGKNWTRLGSDTSTTAGTNWYNRGPNSSSQISSSVFGDSIGWTGSYTKSTTSHDVSFLSGNENVCFRVLISLDAGWSGGYNRDGFLVDDFAISGPSNDKIIGGGIESNAFTKILDLPGNDSAHYYSPNGKLMASIWNLSSHDFGATTVEIDGTGTGTQDFDTNTQAENKIFAKTIKITPTTNNTSASVKIAMYYTNAEYLGWKSGTGEFGKDLQLFKTTNAIASSSVAQGSLPSVTATDTLFNGDDLCIIGTFSNGFSGVGGGGGAGSGGGPLPVTFLHFDGKRETDRVQLEWSTASEVNNHKFIVQRSFGGLDFVNIGEVMGAGNSTTRSNYVFVDSDQVVHTTKTLCYRLKQIDYDGAFELSNVICFNSNTMIKDVTIGPNPFNGVLNITIDPWTPNIYDFKIYDIDGKLVYEQLKLKDGTQHIDVTKLSGGVYFVAILKNGERVEVKKIVKQM